MNRGPAAAVPAAPLALGTGSGGGLRREFPAAVSAFDPAPHTWPASPPAPFADELVSHDDVNLDNVVSRADRAVALIDFDLAGPGSRIWDVACAAQLWAPLRPLQHVEEAGRGRSLTRVRLLVDSYGLDDAELDRLVAAVRLNHEWCYDIAGTAAVDGHPGFAQYWDGGARDRAERTRQWYLDTADVPRDALLC